MPHLRNAFFILILCFFVVPLKAQHEYFSIQTGVNTYKLKNYKEVDGITGKLGFGVRTRLHQYFSFEYNLIYLQDQHCTAESNLFTNIQTIIKIKSHILQNQFLMVLLQESGLPCEHNVPLLSGLIQYLTKCRQGKFKRRTKCGTPTLLSVRPNQQNTQRINGQTGATGF